MSRKRLAAEIVAVLGVLAALAASPAFASGGPGGGGGSGSGGSGGGCAPLTLNVRVGHADGNGNSGIGVQATMLNCSSAPEPMQLAVTVPNSGTVPFTFSTGGAALAPGRSLTMFASPIGSTPIALHYGQTYDVVGTLSETGATPRTLSTITTPVTMPPGVVS
jgi:hypothetical protein